MKMVNISFQTVEYPRLQDQLPSFVCLHQKLKKV